MKNKDERRAVATTFSEQDPPLEAGPLDAADEALGASPVSLFATGRERDSREQDCDDHKQRTASPTNRLGDSGERGGGSHGESHSTCWFAGSLRPRCLRKKIYFRHLEPISYS